MSRLFAALACLVLMAVPAAAQLGTPQIGMERTGTCRTIYVRESATGPQVPIGCVDLTAHTFTLASGAAPSAPVSSVAGRTGAVYLGAGDVSGLAPSATVNALNAANLSSGTLDKARLPVLATGDISGLPAALAGVANAANLTSGTLDKARLPALATGDIGGLQGSLDAKLPLAGGVMTGNLTVNSASPELKVSWPGLEAWSLRTDGDGQMRLYSYNGGSGGKWALDTAGNVVNVGTLAVGGGQVDYVSANGRWNLFNFTTDNRFYMRWNGTDSGLSVGAGGDVVTKQLGDLKTYIDGKASGASASSPFVTPEMYGATGILANDDTAAVQAALNSGKPVRLEQRYPIRADLTIHISNAQFKASVEGSGSSPFSSLVLFNGARLLVTWDGFPSPSDQSGVQVVLRNFTLVPYYQGGDCAVRMTGPANAIGSNQPMMLWDNVNVIPWNPDYYSTNGLCMTDIRNWTVDHSVIQGRYNVKTGNGILLQASAGSAPVDGRLLNSQIVWWSNGANYSPSGQTSGANDAQGQAVLDNTFLAVDNGIYANTTDNFSEWFIVANNHFNFAGTGIYMNGIRKPNIYNNYLLNGFAESHDYVGMYITSLNGATSGGSIHDNTVDCQNNPTPGTRTPVQTVALGGGNTFNRVHDNLQLGCTGYAISTTDFQHDNH